MGKVSLKLGPLMEAKKVSKTKMCKHCDIQRAQLTKYMTDSMTRVDLAVLARFCDYLECDITDILEYKK